MNTVKKHKLLLFFLFIIVCTFSCGILGTGFDSKSVKADTSSVFEMSNGASARLINGDGLRFRVKMSESVKNTVDDNDNKLSVIIMSKEVYDAGVKKGKSNSEIYDIVKNEYCQEINILKDSIYKEGDYYYGNAVLNNVLEENRRMNFVAFAKLGDTFTANSTWNNLYNVVNSAFNDLEKDYTEYILSNTSYNSWFGSEEFPVVFKTEEEQDLFNSRDIVGVKTKKSYLGFFGLNQSTVDYVLDEPYSGALTTSNSNFTASANGTTLTVNLVGNISGIASGSLLNVVGVNFSKCITFVELITNKQEFICWYRNLSKNILNGEYGQNKYVLLNCDLDLSEECFELSGEMNNAFFAGVFNGNGHNISHLNHEYGLFNNVASNGVVKNITYTYDVCHGDNRESFIVPLNNTQIVKSVKVGDEELIYGNNGYVVSANSILISGSKVVDKSIVTIYTSEGTFVFNVSKYDFALGTADEFDDWFRMTKNADDEYYSGKISENLSAKVVLTNDIDLSDKETYITNEKIAEKTFAVFTGVFDGQGYTIYNLTTTGGMFFQLNGTIKNFALVNTVTIENAYSIMGYWLQSAATISNVYYQGTQSGSTNNLGNTGFYSFVDKKAKISNVVVIVDKVCGASADPVSRVYGQMGYAVDCDSLYVVNNTSRGSTDSPKVHYYSSVLDLQKDLKMLPVEFDDEIWTTFDGVPIFKTSIHFYRAIKNSIENLTITVPSIKIETPVTLESNKSVKWYVKGLDEDEYNLEGNVLTVSGELEDGQPIIVGAIYVQGIVSVYKEITINVVSNYTVLDDIYIGLNRERNEINIEYDAIVSNVIIDGNVVNNGYSIENGKLLLSKSLFETKFVDSELNIKIFTNMGNYLVSAKIVDFALGTADEFDDWFRMTKNADNEYYSGKISENLSAKVVLTNDIDLSNKETYITNEKIADKTYAVFTGVFDGQGHTIYNLTTTGGMFFQLNGIIKNFALVNTVTTKNAYSIMGYWLQSAATISNVYYQGSQPGTSNNLGNTGFYSFVSKEAKISNVVVIVDKVCGADADPVSRVYGQMGYVVDCDSLYVVNNTSRGSTDSPKVNWYSSLDDFKKNVTIIPNTFPEKYWKIENGQLVFRSVEVEEIIVGKNRTSNFNIYIEKGASVSEILINGTKITSNYNTYPSTGRVLLSYKLFSKLSGSVTVSIKTANKTYNYIASVFDFAIGNSEEFSKWYNDYKNNIDKTVILTDDIDLHNIHLENVSNWIDAGSTLYFNGMVDGRNHTIANFSADVALIPGIGETGLIMNLKMTNFVINDSYALLGTEICGKLLNCYFEGKNNAENSVDGGVWNLVSLGAVIDNVTVIYLSDLDRSNIPAIAKTLSGSLSKLTVVSNNNNGKVATNCNVTSGYKLYSIVEEKQNEITDYVIVYNELDKYVVEATSFMYSHINKAYNSSFKVENTLTEWDDSVKAIVVGDKSLLYKAGIIVQDGEYIVKKVGETVFVYATDSMDYQVAVIKLLELMIGFDDLGNNAIIYSNINQVMPEMDFQNKVSFKYRVTGYTNATLDKTNVSVNANDVILEYDQRYGMGYVTSPIMSVPNRYYFEGRTSDSDYSDKTSYHNVLYYLPPEMYAESHSKWYASIEGSSILTWKSSKSSGQENKQLCYTAHGDKVELEAMKLSVLDYMKVIIMQSYNIDKTYIAFTQLDNYSECSCSACSSKGATLALLEFIDDVIGRLNEWLNTQNDSRSIKGVMFAYHSTEKAPNTNKKFDNVAILIAPIRASYLYDIDDDTHITDIKLDGVTSSKWTNADCKENILKWSNICAESLVWLYQSHFYNTEGRLLGGYMEYYASIDALISWLKFCKTINATFIFNQGDHTAKVLTAFGGLKNYIESKAYIDLDYVEQNYDLLVENYFNNYFGPAGVKMMDFYNQTNVYVKDLVSRNNGSGGILDEIFTKWTKSQITVLFSKLDSAYQVLNDAYMDKTCPEYIEFKRRLDLESISPRFINAYRNLGCTSSYYGYSRKSVYTDMLSLGFDRYAESSGCLMSDLKVLWNIK